MLNDLYQHDADQLTQAIDYGFGADEDFDEDEARYQKEDDDYDAAN